MLNRQGITVKVFAVVVVAAACILAIFYSDRILTYDDTRPCDVVLVVAGDYDKRIASGVALLTSGIGQHLVVDVVDEQLYGVPSRQLVSQYLQVRLSPGEYTLCVFNGDSTIMEARRVRPCLQSLKEVRSVLLVTNDFHSRRALLTFKHVIPDLEFHVHAVEDHDRYEQHWWRRRQSAKMFVDSMLKMGWYLLVERWTAR